MLAHCSPTPVVSFDEFDAAYRALTGHDGACRWQYRLFADLEAGRFPTDVELATGLGKTSIIALWGGGRDADEQPRHSLGGHRRDAQS
jgi:hypothetical protein